MPLSGCFGPAWSLPIPPSSDYVDPIYPKVKKYFKLLNYMFIANVYVYIYAICFYPHMHLDFNATDQGSIRVIPRVVCC